MISFVGLLLLAQPDTDTLVVIFITGIIMLFVSGANWKYLGSLLLIMIIGVLVLASFRPYLKDRLLVYVGMKDDVEGSAYQINQSQIAIGSGQIVGRGFGQSIQKFGYLPQPTDDSIFAVLAEEFGFIGSSLLILLYISYTISTYRIGTRTKDIFGSRLAIGVGTLVFIQSMLNIATMIGVIPLAGLPLLFISHGGTALVIILMASGMVASVSRNMD